jgi:hypothetical protein
MPSGLLERSWPNEYARTERVEQIGEKTEPKPGVTILYQVPPNGTLAELVDFPNLETDSPKVVREKQRRLDVLFNKPVPDGRDTPEPAAQSDAPPP